MSLWIPQLKGRSGPVYRMIVEALADDIAAGRLAPGSRLPPHRDLAWRLKCTVGTIARAYAEAARQGLVSGQVGRGTYVLEEGGGARHIHDYVAARQLENESAIDMAINRPMGDNCAAHVSVALRRLADLNSLPYLLGYQFDGIAPRYRQAVARWLRGEGVEADPERVILTTGGQQAILVVLAALSRPGDTIFAEELTYPGLKVAASLLDREVEGVAMDRHGLIPEALEQAFQSGRGRVVYCMPTNQNPTVIVMPLERRQAIIEVLRRYDAYLVEDGIYAFLADDPPVPLWTMAPDRVVYLSSLSKAVAPALRIGFAVAPETLLNRINANVSASTMMVSPLLAEVATMLIEDGGAAQAAEAQRREARERVRLAVEALGAVYAPPGPSFNLWLPLPPQWRADAFAAEAYRRGVVVAPAGSFATTRRVPEAVRLSVSAPVNREDLRVGLKVVGDLLASTPASVGMTI
ncbi:MAG TPA: PLP-dependent aminotransferase family protein [Candidatus Sulfotelmatobacter sp.]|jgi:DNA-binding transcriptional MocR family regulator|nr:PLP-dependent aminotransferase family protein [Candidatus Sulfotelmatobacter sp.]